MTSVAGYEMGPSAGGPFWYPDSETVACLESPGGVYDEIHRFDAFRSMTRPLTPRPSPPPAREAALDRSDHDESTRQLDVPGFVEDDARDSLYLREPVDDNELPAGTHVGRYAVLAPLGKGGMGVVYEAWDPQLDRMVALKVLRIAQTRDGRPLPNLQLGEAQTLAKIAHPNIVTVYDAGVTDGRVFIAMALCRGQNLRQWLAQGEHGVQEILQVFRAAGRGLAAAHNAGIVHQDFKPANVLIDEDNAVQVADFGMARLAAMSIEAEAGSIAWASDPDRSVSTIVGTPPYMAPEQLLGRLGDHRMDQFSFCLCLYWALLGHPPFGGGTFQERRRTVPLGLDTAARERLSRARHVPVRVRRALLRGLSVDPTERFESMELLLAELAERRSWPWWLVSLPLAVGLGLGALAMSEVHEEEPCDGAQAALEGTWGPEHRRALADAFERAQYPSAPEQLERVAGAFDRYAGEWKDAHYESCRATYVTHVQSEATFDLRIRCLERQRAQLGSAVETMVEAADAEALDDRMSLPFELSAVDECSDVDALASVAPLHRDPETRARIDETVRRIDLANTLRKSGESEQGLKLAREVVVEARKLDHPPVLAQALECLGRLQTDGESPRVAESTLREAIAVGSRSDGDDLLVARAWPSLVFTLILQDELVAGESLSFAAELAVERVDDDLARGWLYNTMGILHSELGNHDQARRDLERALASKSRLRGAQDYDVGITWNNLGSVLAGAGHWSEAADAFGQAQAIFAATVGPDHFMSDVAMTGVCRVALNRDDYEHALELCTEVLRRLESTPTSPAVMSRVLVVTAKALRGLGRVEEALQMARKARGHVARLDQRQVADIDEWIEDVRREQAELEAERSRSRRLHRDSRP